MPALGESLERARPDDAPTNEHARTEPRDASHDVVGVVERRAEPIEHIAAHLAQRWAPVYVQHVDARDHGADRPTRIDFDGNWDATDNWTQQRKHGTRLPPAAYSAVVLTATHAYLTYTLFYPRDWTRVCVPLVCHDNDLETVQIVVRRDAADGTIVRVRTKAHHSMRDIASTEIARAEDGRPMFRVEARGHGIAACRLDDPACAATPGRLVYAPAMPGTPPSAPPAEPNGQTVRYELLPLRDTLWARRDRGMGRLWSAGETGPLYYHGRSQGRVGNPLGAAMATSKYVGGVRPPWALKGRSGKRGDWFLDPATDVGVPAPYVYNPFLDDLANECKGPSCTPAPPEPSRVKYYAKLAAPYGALALGTLVLSLLVRSRVAVLRF